MGKGVALVDVAGTESPSQDLLVAPAKSLWSDTSALPRGLGGLGRGQRPAGCKSGASLLGKPGLFPSSSHPGRGGNGMCGATSGVTAGCGLGDVSFACGETGSVIMSLG